MVRQALAREGVLYPSYVGCLYSFGLCIFPLLSKLLINPEHNFAPGCGAREGVPYPSYVAMQGAGQLFFPLSVIILLN